MCIDDDKLFVGQDELQLYGALVTHHVLPTGSDRVRAQFANKRNQFLVREDCQMRGLQADRADHGIVRSETSLHKLIHVGLGRFENRSHD